MDKLSNILRFKAQCPFLGSTKTSTIQTLYTHASPNYPTLNRLTEKATGCPVMGPVLTSRSRQIVAGYASVADNAEVKKLHEGMGVDMQEASIAEMEKCPHASAALSAARRMRDLESAQKQHSEVIEPAQTTTTSTKPTGCPFHNVKVAEPAHTVATPTKPAGCPFHNAKAETTPSQPAEQVFDYEKFYAEELDKKRADNSYRYFNNINRMAQKFPLAHTGNVTDQVEVWCANDYLGMGNNPVVLESMQ